MKINNLKKEMKKINNTLINKIKKIAKHKLIQKNEEIFKYNAMVYDFNEETTTTFSIDEDDFNKLYTEYFNDFVNAAFKLTIIFYYDKSRKKAYPIIDDENIDIDEFMGGEFLNYIYNDIKEFKFNEQAEEDINQCLAIQINVFSAFDVHDIDDYVPETEDDDDFISCEIVLKNKYIVNDLF